MRLLRAIATVLVLALVVAGGYLFYPRLQPFLFRNDVTAAEIALVAPPAPPSDLLAIGHVVPQARSKVGAKITARVASVLVKEGDLVKKGQILAKLDDADVRSAINAARSRVSAAGARARTARANLDEVSQQLRRQQNLYKQDAAPKAAIDTLAARERSLSEQVRVADAEMGATRSETAVQQVTLSYTNIVSPIEGTIVNKPVEVGELVGPASRPVAEVADFRTLRVEVEVPEARLHTMKVGAPCEIALDAFGGKRHVGETEEIGKQVNREKATAMVKVKFVDAMDGVLPGMMARVSFPVAPSDAVPPAVSKRVVPASAVVDRAGRKGVFVIMNGKATLTVVKVGATTEVGLELLEGPPPGTKVVLNPEGNLEDGQSITAAN